MTQITQIVLETSQGQFAAAHRTASTTLKKSTGYLNRLSLSQ